MNRCLKIGLMSACLFTSIGSLAETLSEYAEACKAALEIDSIPGYSCSDGEFISNPNDLLIEQDAINRLGKVDTGNPNVDAIYLCRGISGSGSGQTAKLNGYILQNRVNGETCFFDAIVSSQSENLPDIDSVGADSRWLQPGDINGNCYACHSNDPFIVSPALASAFKNLDLLYNGRNLKGSYRAVNSNLSTSHFSGWNNLIQNQINQNSENCANSCHRLTSGLMQTWANQSKNEGWMAPTPTSDFHVVDTLIQNKNFHISNFWAGDWFLHIQQGVIEATPIEPGWWSAQWRFEKVGSYYRIKNRWKQNEFLHVQFGQLEAGEIDSGWWSAQWTIEKFSSYYRIKNRWTNEYINVEGGSLKASTLDGDWWSARWYFNELN